MADEMIWGLPIILNKELKPTEVKCHYIYGIPVKVECPKKVYDELLKIKEKYGDVE